MIANFHELNLTELQLTEDGEITEIGQCVQKNVEEENKRGRECVTTLLLKTEEQTVRVTVPKLSLVTNTHVQVKEYRNL